MTAAMPAAGPAAIPRSAAFDLDGGSLGAYRIFLAWPAAPPPPAGYPAIFHLDGNAHFGTFVDSARAQTTRPDLTGTEPGLIVGIGYPSEEPLDLTRRTLDYTPCVPREQLGSVPSGEPWPPTGGADAFLAFIAGTVKPEIERRFPIDRRRLAIFGHSFGGLFVLNTLLSAPEHFRCYVASSPSLWYGGRVLFDRLTGLEEKVAGRGLGVQVSVGGLEQTAPATGGPAAAAYAEWVGRNRMIDNARAFGEHLARVPGLDAHFHIFEGEHHGSVAPSAVSRAIRFAFDRSWEQPQP